MNFSAVSLNSCGTSDSTRQKQWSTEVKTVDTPIKTKYCWSEALGVFLYIGSCVPTAKLHFTGAFLWLLMLEALKQLVLFKLLKHSKRFG